MKKKLFFEGKKIEVFAPAQRLENFSISEIFSSEKFPIREYFQESVQKNNWTLSALHVNESEKIAVFVWAAK